MQYDNVHIRWTWANWESRNAWVWVWDPFNHYGNTLNKWFRLRQDNFDTIQNMLVVAAMTRVNESAVSVVTDNDSNIVAVIAPIG